MAERGIIEVVCDNDDATVSERLTEEVERIARRVLTGEDIAWSHVGIILAGHRTVTELNRTWLKHDYDTDVLSFVIDTSDQGLEGEVYVDMETAAERHEEFGSSYDDEVLRYVVHGVLHLAGHDDQTAEGERLMTHLENRYLVTPSCEAARRAASRAPASE